MPPPTKVPVVGHSLTWGWVIKLLGPVGQRSAPILPDPGAADDARVAEMVRGSDPLENPPRRIGHRLPLRRVVL